MGGFHAAHRNTFVRFIFGVVYGGGGPEGGAGEESV